jgi:hypothetical protein
VEYYRSDELIQRGIAAAEQALPAIKRAYAQKLAPWVKREAPKTELEPAEAAEEEAQLAVSTS